MGCRDLFNCSTSNWSKYVCQCVTVREYQARLGGLGSLVLKWSCRPGLDMCGCLSETTGDFLYQRDQGTQANYWRDYKVCRLTEITICASQSLCFSLLFLSTQCKTTGDKGI